jgi:hypothetical protein
MNDVRCSIHSRSQRVITPINSFHHTVMMAIERANLQTLILDNRVLWNHRALTAVMTSQQVRSPYLESLITHLQAGVVQGLLDA